MFSTQYPLIVALAISQMGLAAPIRPIAIGEFANGTSFDPRLNQGNEVHILQTREPKAIGHFADGTSIQGAQTFDGPHVQGLRLPVAAREAIGEFVDGTPFQRAKVFDPTRIHGPRLPVNALDDLN